MILEFIIRNIVISRNPHFDVTKTFFYFIKEFQRIYNRQKFPSKHDIDRLHELRSWGNLAAHDIFPAISKGELDRNKNIVHRLIKELVKLEPALF